MTWKSGMLAVIGLMTAAADLVIVLVAPVLGKPVDTDFKALKTFLSGLGIGEIGKTLFFQS